MGGGGGGGGVSVCEWGERWGVGGSGREWEGVGGSGRGSVCVCVYTYVYTSVMQSQVKSHLAQSDHRSFFLYVCILYYICIC